MEIRSFLGEGAAAECLRRSQTYERKGKVRTVANRAIASLTWSIRDRDLSAFGTGRPRDPVGYAIIPRGDTEIDENHCVMKCVPEVFYDRVLDCKCSITISN